MISVANFSQWIQHPETLSRDTLYELRNLLAKYPYFQTLRLLYLKNLYILHDIDFGKELRKAVLYVADRRKLFQLIEGESFIVQIKERESFTETLEKEPSVDRTLTLIDAFLADFPEEATPQAGLDYSVDYTPRLLEDATTPEAGTAEAAPPLKGHELIDDFIEKNKHDSGVPLPKEEETMPPFTSPEVNGVKDEYDDSYFTETLAKIYIKQQRYSKALEIFKKLSLKYPKKSTYFADQIQLLEKLIINANSK